MTQLTHVPIKAKNPQEGGATIAPRTRRSARYEGRPSKIAYNVFNMRLTQVQFDKLKKLRDRTGITVQAHIRRAILDYFHIMKQDHPDLFIEPRE